MIAEVDEERGFVVVDTNHPLAGMTLEFEVTVVAVRDAPAVGGCGGKSKNSRDTNMGGLPMEIRAQVSMVFHLDKCIGCHTCTIACKNIWTDRKGTEEMYWNNGEAKPGTGYPTRWE